MKKSIILFFSLFIISVNSFAQGGVQFTDASWSEILNLAQKENKLIFVDAYTTWCGPCKQMSRKVFTQEDAGNYYNAHFINVKKDMEKGEGVQLAKTYNIRAYPTLLFINGEGKIIHRAVGYHDTEQFLELGNAANDPTRQLAAMDARYARGDRNPDFLYNYTAIKADAMDGSHIEIADAYLKTQKDWSTQDNMSFIFRYVEEVDSKMFDYFVENRQAFETLYGTQAVTNRLENIVNNVLYTTVGDEAIAKAERLFKKTYPERAERLTSDFKKTYYRQRGDGANYAKAAIAHFQKFPTKDSEELNEAAWVFYEEVEDKALLKQAMKWACKSIKMAPNYFNHDTLAALYYKMGKSGKAKKIAKKAIVLAKAEGEDYSLTEELLEKIEQK